MNVTVLQWNIMYSENIEQIGAFIAELNPDIVCLQELTKHYHPAHPDIGQYLAKLLSYHGFFEYGPMVLPDGRPALVGNGLLSRHPLARQQRIVIQEGVTDSSSHITQDERLYLQAQVELPGHPIIIGTTHLPFHPRFHTSPAKQAMVERILHHIPNKSTNFIFTGDINSTPGSKAAKTLRRRLKHAGPNLNQKTWTTKPFHIGPYSYELLNWRLDYVLYQGRLCPIQSQIIKTDLSDHLPILTEFTV